MAPFLCVLFLLCMVWVLLCCVHGGCAEWILCVVYTVCAVFVPVYAVWPPGVGRVGVDPLLGVDPLQSPRSRGPARLGRAYGMPGAGRGIEDAAEASSIGRGGTSVGSHRMGLGAGGWAYRGVTRVAPQSSAPFGRGPPGCGAAANNVKTNS